MPPQTQKITYAPLVPFSNGRRESANPSSRVIVLPDSKFSNISQTSHVVFLLGISVPSLRTWISGDRSHPYRKDRWRLHFYVCGLPSRAGNSYDSLATPLGIQRVEPLNQICVCLSCCSACLIYLFSIFVMYFCHFILLYLNNCVVIYYFAL